MKYFTFWLAGLCVLFFLLQLLIPTFTDSFVLNQQAFLQPWRFLSSIFLHGSLIHLVYNMFALLMFGFILEKKI